MPWSLKTNVDMGKGWEGEGRKREGFAFGYNPPVKTNLVTE